MPANRLMRLSSKLLHDSELVSFHEDQVRATGGSDHPYALVRFKVCGVAILPIDADGCTRLVGQHRYVSDRYTWELVRGAGNLADPLGAAKRELHEETGLMAQEWMQILELMASPGVTDEIAPCFLAWRTIQGRPHRDDTEDLTVRSLPFSEAVEMALSGEIVDASSCATLLAVHARRQRGDLPREVAQRLR